VRDSQVDEIGSEREGCTARVWDTLRNQAISERVLGLAQIKAAHTTDKQVADGKAEEAP
jgi:hypothetical protein